MNRRALIVNLYNIILGFDRTVRSKINLFNELLCFIRFIDERNISNVFCVQSIDSYLKEFLSKYRNGIKGVSLNQKQSSIKAIIKELDSDLFDDV